MSDRVYCFRCQTSHPKGEMRQVVAKNGKQWRCIMSIRAAKADIATREAFGEQKSAKNREAAQIKARVLNAEK